MIANTINKQIAQALKAGDKIRLSTFRLLLASLHNAKIAKRADLTKEEELEIVRREAKKRKDAIEAYQKAGAKERAQKEKQEFKILQEFLPKQLSDQEISSLVEEAIEETGATGMADMGKVMGTVMAKVKGRAEGGRVLEVVRSKL